MAINQLKVTGINPILSVLGDTQRFNYNPDNAFFSIKSNFQPIQNVNSNLSMEFRNVFENGFRITHETDINGGVGQLKFKSFLNSSFTGTDLLTLNNNGVVFNLPASFPSPINPTDAANKQYVDSKTWLTSQITNFDTAVRAYKLSDFLAPTSNISLANFNLINIADPLNAQDAVTKSYADNLQKSVNLSGAISGSGSTGSTITTAFNLRLDQIALPTASLNLNSQKIINLSTPVLGTDGANKNYVDSAISGIPTASITLTGDVTGVGSVNSPISTTLVKRLDQLNSPTSSVNFNSQKIANLATPTLLTDAANKGYVDNAISGISTNLTLQGAISGSGATSSAITTTMNTRLDQVPTPTQPVSLNGQRITNLATPTLATDAVTKAYVDSSVGGVATSITLQGDISGTGSTGSAITTTFNKRLDQIMAPTASLNLNSQKIINLAIPVLSTDAANKNYIDSKTWTASQITDFDSQVRLSRLDQMAIPTASINLNAQKIINLATPTLSTDAVNKNYADTSTLSPSRLTGYPSSTSLFLRGDGTWATPSGGSASLSSNSINVNTDGGNTNWLRRNINTTTGGQVYGLTSGSYILESNNGESAGIGFDGGTDTCTIWTAGDGGTYLNIQDEDATNSRTAYVATNGAWTVVSSEKRKHSIRSKSNNNVLERFLNLSVKTYGYKYSIGKDCSEDKKRRMEKKANKMATGLILEEVFKIFPNCLPDYYNRLFQNKKDNAPIFEEEVKDPENSGIDYNTLMCYFIMAFQEYVKKTDEKIIELASLLENH